MRIISQYPYISDGELNYCDGVAYQQDRAHSVSYDIEYYRKYIDYEGTGISNCLNNFRVALTEKYYCNKLIDVGIGSGEFVRRSRMWVFGYDINPHAVEWLKDKKLFVDPYVDEVEVDGVTLWDVLEHLPDPSKLLDKVKRYLFVSIPIFENFDMLKTNKHYRPNEHFFYFTNDGFMQYMDDMGFNVLENRDDETQCSREGIKTYVMKRKK